MQTVREENERKKRYLSRYRQLIQRIKWIEREISELRSMQVSISINNDGMPHGSGKTDLSGYAAELDRRERCLMEEQGKIYLIYVETSSLILQMKDEKERDVLYYRYIMGLGWDKIAEKMAFSVRHITRIHGRALDSFPLSKEKMS